MWSSTVLSGTERDTRELKAESGGGITYPQRISLWVEEDTAKQKTAPSV